MADKIRYGLRKAKYAVFNETTKTYGTLKSIPGAVSLSFTREGGDSSDFYADDGIYYTFAGTNGGYSADFEVARVTDEMRVDLLGEITDSETGLQYEKTDGKAAQFALVFETQGDLNPIGFVFYSCKASRPEMNANTKNESPDVDTETLNIRIAAQDFVYNNSTQSFVQGHIEKTEANATKYNALFSSVVTPGTPAGQSGLSA